MLRRSTLQRPVTCVRRRHVQLARGLHWHALLLGELHWHVLLLGELRRHALHWGEPHRHAPHRDDLPGDAPRLRVRPPRRAGPRRWCVPRCREHTGCDWPPRRLHRDSCRRRHLRSDGYPIRGHSPNRPMGPCPGRCRRRSIPARKNHWARRRREHIRNSRTNTPVEYRCRRQLAREPPAPGPGPQAMRLNRIVF
jgi:hypothetical protein